MKKFVLICVVVIIAAGIGGFSRYSSFLEVDQTSERSESITGLRERTEPKASDPEAGESLRVPPKISDRPTEKDWIRAVRVEIENQEYRRARLQQKHEDSRSGESYIVDSGDPHEEERLLSEKKTER